MKWIVDRIEDNIAVLEQIETKEKKEVSIAFLPFPIHEGAFLSFSHGEYMLNQEEEKQRREKIEKRFKNLRKDI